MKLFNPITILQLDERPRHDEGGSRSSREWLRLGECQRFLAPAYLFMGIEIAWQCSESGKLFSVSVDDVFAPATEDVPNYIEAEFHLHNCALHLLGSVLT